MYTFGPLIAKNSRSGRLLGGAPVTVTTLAGVTLSTVPAPLVTNHEGYLPAFTVDTDQRVILARPRGGDPLPLYAHEGLQDAAEAADTINTGRLSEASLKSTIATQTEPLARQVGEDAAVDILSRQPEVTDAAATRAVSVAADPAIAGAITSLGSATGDALAVVTTTASRNHTNFYVAPDGDDNNSGAFGSPYRTLAKALSLLPDVIRSDHLYNIRLHPGTWDETIDVKHLVVYGHLIIQGTTTNRADHRVHRVKFTKVYGTVTVRNLSTTIKDNTLPSFEYESSGPYMALTNVAAEYGPGEADGGSPTGEAVVGVLADRGSNVYVAGSDFSGKRYGMRANTLSRIFSSDNTGTGNHRGLGARFGGILAAYGTQPQGLTPISSDSGGIIVHGAGGTVGPLSTVTGEPGLADRHGTVDERHGRKLWLLRPGNVTAVGTQTVPAGSAIRFRFRRSGDGPHTIDARFHYMPTTTTATRFVRKVWAGNLTTGSHQASPVEMVSTPMTYPPGVEADSLLTTGHTGANGEFYIDVQAHELDDAIRGGYWGVDIDISMMRDLEAPVLYDVEIVDLTP